MMCTKIVPEILRARKTINNINNINNKNVYETYKTAAAKTLLLSLNNFQKLAKPSKMGICELVLLPMVLFWY